MIKTDEITKQVTFKEKTRYCDFCGTKMNMSGYSYTTCQICSKDVCKKCVGHEEDIMGDYGPDVWCKTCWEIGEEYRKKIEEHEKEIERLSDEWYKKCKK